MSSPPPPVRRRRRAGLSARARVQADAAAKAVALTRIRRRRASAQRRPRGPVKSRLLRVMILVIAVIAAIGAGSLGAVFAAYNAYKGSLPDAATIVGMEQAADSYVYDSQGQVIKVFHDADFRHTHVPLAEVSRWVKLATVDVEDRHFYDPSEGSWDFGRLIAAGVNNVTHHGDTQGASTIAEQLAKLSLPGGTSQPRSLDYKVKEIVLGNEIWLNFDKDKILEMYLNRIYYGNHATGIETAAELFFKKPASQLDLAEATMLVGLPQSPSAYNPFNCTGPNCINPLAKTRQHDVLNAMVRNGDISPAAEQAAYVEPLTFHQWTESEPSTFPSFTDYVKHWLESKYGGAYTKPGGWRIFTTIDPAKQALADKTVHDQVAKVANLYNMHDGSLVSLDPKTGEVLAMVGAASYPQWYSGTINDNLANTPITPGSTIKLFTYTSAIASGKFTMTTPIVDAPYTFPGTPPYSPLDYDRHWHGTCQLKQCLGNSFNMPAVKVEYAVGIDYVTNMEIAMGVNSINQKGGGGGGGGTNRPGPVNWAATLGSLDYGIKLVDLADGAATIADMGVHHEATPVTKIIDNLSGRTLFKYDPIGSGRRVVPENVAFIMNEITSNDSNRLREFGSHGPLTFCDTSIGDAPAECARRVSAKTGTADYFLDNLTVGWTPDLLTAVWVGNSTRNCLQSKDYATVNHAVARGNVVEPEQRTVVPPSSYPSSPHDVAHYGLKPVASDHGCGHLDGIVSGYSGAAPIWHQFMYNALKGTPKAWYTRPADIVASGPGDDADFFIPSSTTSVPNGCFYWGTAPDPNNPCTYTGTEPPAGYVPPTPGPAEPAPTTAPAPRLCKHPPCRPAP